MSDVLVKGMEMPEGCVECPLLLAYGSRLENKIIHHCMGRLPEDSRFSDDADLTERPKEGCPLVEVKAHGRLIDADKLREALLSDEDYRVFVIEDIDDVIKKYIDTAPTVLEANKWQDGLFYPLEDNND